MAKKKVTAKELQGKKPVTLEIGGKEYELTYNFGVLGELEECYGTVEKAMQELQKGKIKAISRWIWANMLVQDDNENLTVRQVERMLNVDFMERVIEKMNLAMEQSFGDPTGEELGE
ncbi:hypothetical protein [Inconstantimicrobium mannanitabidum]|uniref:Uncharacterized protein n=1 Tax=Inconstantimicrobium mannanitabidum TaxID=1604901 RepID=A0ACB5R9W0_9CLOT|nr:hypothetical protein [Clostridium sp. TW13]GKX65649.1 hypothetical protein rsdtw13_09070 [Clostridium sp. TW13]